MDYQKVLNKSINGERISLEEAVVLFKEAPLMELGETANKIRHKLHSDPRVVTFVVDRNINYTNACTAGCRFCAFAHWPDESKENDKIYILKYEEIKNKIHELVNENGTQILLQGGHHPDLGIEYYEALFKRIKSDFPHVVLHALSPSEIDHITKVDNLSLDETLNRLVDSGWESFPGGGAEILVDRVRNILSPLKTDSDRWLEIMEAAHNKGIQGSATMMFGHVETFEERVQHMDRIRSLQDKTKGFRAFISWPFQKGATPLSKDERLQEGEGTGDGLDYLRTQAISRIFLDNIQNIQASWVTMGFGIGQVALQFGANDFGGTMMEENVVSAAGTMHSKSNTEELIYQIGKAAYKAVQRDTFYKPIKEFDTVLS
ncbi:MAG: cyclic dehypoxanthinyl futalosine synthase [Candidatus Caenarcaniphilales bacterium]|nr:cyclic dehypoxanthinyl futalosine synthase [Candidatus Caenarcaniphilales bacterium]